MTNAPANAELLAAKFASGVVGLHVEGETPTIMIAVSIPERDLIVAALRTSPRSMQAIDDDAWPNAGPTSPRSDEVREVEGIVCCRAQGPDSKCFCPPRRRKALWLASTIMSHQPGTSYKGKNADNVRLCVQMLIDELSALAQPTKSAPAVLPSQDSGALSTGTNDRAGADASPEWTTDQIIKGVRGAAAFCDCCNHPDASEWASACRLAAHHLAAQPAEAPAGCICQNQHRRGYCTEPGCRP